MKKLFKCNVCGYVHERLDAPERCPKCGATKDKFTLLSDEDAKKIYISDRTNDIHMELVLLAATIADLCAEGIELDLDPACVDDFVKARDEAWTIKQRAKAELETHMQKGKW